MSPMTRRGLLAASAALPLAACATPPGGPPLSAAPPAPWTPDATTMAAMIRRGDITAVEAVEAAIRRAEALQPQLNFLTTRAFDQAMDRARRGGLTGPFAGVPTLVKDLDDLRGFPTKNGARYAMAAPPATGQDPYVDALERAGFIFIGKSATPEHGFLPTTEPLAFGPTRNPWDPSRSSGGSSGGAAAAVAAGVVPLAHATDGGGSIRIPASCCGLFGLKPSRGRLIQEASDLPIILGVGHVVSHSVRDSAAMFAAGERLGSGAAYPPVGMVSAPVGRRLRVGLVMESGVGRTPSDEVQAAIRSTAALLADLGHTVEPTVWPIHGTRFAQDFTTLWAAGAAQLVAEVGKGAGRTPDETLLEPFTLAMARQIQNAPKGAVEAAIGRLKADALAYDGWFARFDVILSPVLGHAPPPLGEFRGDVNYEDLQERLVNYVGYTPLHNVAGAPAMSVPLYWTQGGLPVGSQIAARAGGDGLLLELAYELEQARPWAHLRPSVSVL